jgi:hypothetical protein
MREHDQSVERPEDSEDVVAWRASSFQTAKRLVMWAKSERLNQCALEQSPLKEEMALDICQFIARKNWQKGGNHVNSSLEL